jgi:DNA topoisomerase I
MELALTLLAAPKSDEPIGELDGYPVFAKNGRYGPYVQWGSPDDLPPGLDKPKMASLFATMTLERLTVDEAEKLLSLPRVVGEDPTDGEPITAQNGRYGPYVSKGKESRSLANEEQIFTHHPRRSAGACWPNRASSVDGVAEAPKPPLREFGTDPVSGRPVVAKEGRFGVYVTDGETNASLSKGDRLEVMLPERAYELLAVRRESVAAQGGPKKKAAPRRSPAKKTPAKKSPAKKSRPRRPPPRRPPPRRLQPRRPPG